MHILKLKNTDLDFYPLMGPFLSQRSIVKELGAPIWDDAGKRWYVAMIDGSVVGFAAVFISVKQSKLTFCSAYVLKANRCQGIYSELLTARLADWKTETLRTVATEHARSALDRYGFVFAKARGRFWEMERPADA